MHTDVTVQTSSNNRDRNRDTATGIGGFLRVHLLT